MSGELRIKLAEAMNFDPTGKASLPDPFTDANDDYAVLEWMRGNTSSTQCAVFADTVENLSADNFAIDTHYGPAFTLNNAVGYKVGDYARAACEALGL